MSDIILVADDDADARAIVCLGIQALGYSFVEASDGEAAFKAYLEHHPSLAVLDMNMPGLTGKELCFKIKSTAEGIFVPVLMLTANDGVKDKVSAFEGGVDDYLTKPFHLEELQARIKALLRVRDLTIRLNQKNNQLQEMQEKLVQHERQALVSQLAGTAAHQLGQPLSAIMLNCHLLDRIPQSDDRYKKALQSIKDDAKRMADLLSKLKSADAAKKEEYHGTDEILDISSSSSDKKKTKAK